VIRQLCGLLRVVARRRVLPVAIALCIAACSRSPTNSPPVVQFMPDMGPSLILTRCNPIECEFARRLRNVGTGCAAAVRAGVTALRSGTPEPLATYQWALPSDQVVRPLEVIEVRIIVPTSIHDMAAGWRIDPSWTDTPC
jgi:hypothetical protein